MTDERLPTAGRCWLPECPELPEDHRHPPTTEAGRVWADDLVVKSGLAGTPWHAEVEQRIHAIEAEARQQDGSATGAADCQGTHHYGLCASCGAYFAALPPSAPPALDVERLTEIDSAASIAHDYIAPRAGDKPSQAAADKAIWRIHEIVRPVLEKDARRSV